MAVNRTDHGLALEARGQLMQVVTAHQVGQNPDLKNLVGDIGKQLLGATSQIQQGAAEARQLAAQPSPDRGEGRGA